MHRTPKLTLAVARPFWGALVGLFVLLFGATASIAAVHHALHHDADSRSEDCAVCSFAKSQVDSADVSVASRQLASPVEISAIPTKSFLAENPSFLLPLGRAPPILSVVS